ncbi:hypothetical protein FOXYSP1_10727 [Fusarium oxysporum f. sp. phaseoli]
MDMKAEFAFPSSSKLALKLTIASTLFAAQLATKRMERVIAHEPMRMPFHYMQKTRLLRTTELAVMPLLHAESPKSGGKRVAFRGQEHATRKPPASVKTEIKNEHKQAAKALQSSAQQDGGGGGEAPGDE